MPDDLAGLRRHLPAFLAARHVDVLEDGTLPCPNPAHDGATPAQLQGERVFCGTCNTAWDVFDVCGLLDGVPNTPASFSERLTSVRRTLAAHEPEHKPIAETTDAELTDAKAHLRHPRADADYIKPPFRILGVEGDRGWYIGRGDTLISLELSTLGKTKLMQLACITWWQQAFEGAKGRLDQDQAVDWLVDATRARQFEPSMLRGRGAWCESDGSLCFHDGEITVGTPDGRHIYQRKADLGMLGAGVRDVPADADTRARMREAAKAMAFETEADFGRLLSWAAIAPFCGALPWRPAGLLTGESGWGKSTIVHLVIEPLALPLTASAGTGGTTEAGIRQLAGNDARAYVIEESEVHSDADRARLQGIFALMRQSVMDGGPQILKGTPSGRSLHFDTKCMFLFVAITQGIETYADAKRLFIVDLKPPEGHWPSIRARIVAAFTPANCAGVRAHTWAHLRQIIDGAQAMQDAVGEAGGFDSRYAMLESILWSTYWTVWRDGIPDPDSLRAWLQGVYAVKPPERLDNDAVSTLTRLLDNDVPLHGAPGRRYTIAYLLRHLGSENDGGDFRQTLLQYGLSRLSTGEVAVPLDRVQIAKIVGQPQYAKVMRRHPLCSDRSHVVTPAGETSRRCMLFSASVLEGEPGI